MAPTADRTVVITGAAKGIGHAIASRLADEGARLALFDVDAEALAATATDLEGRGTKVRTWQVDIAEAPSCQQAVDEVVAEFGGIDALVNNAGIGIMSQFLDLSLEQWRRTFDINVTGTFVLTQYVGRKMAEAGSGAIVNIASIAGKSGSANLADYCASKAGVISLTQSAAKALGPLNVRVNAVCPGLVWTPMWRQTATWIGENDPALRESGLSPEQVYDAAVKASTPLGLPTTPEDIAATVAWLLGPDARLITGQAVNVDGGIEVH